MRRDIRMRRDYSLTTIWAPVWQIRIIDMALLSGCNEA